MGKHKEIKTIPSKEVGNIELFHINFDKNLSGIWQPRLPAGSEEKAKSNEPDTWQYPEPSMPAISLSSSIVGCFRAVYPNVYKYFEEKNYPHMDFQVYSPVLKGDERIVIPPTLAQDGWCWDAMVTQEYRILDQVEMKWVGEVRIDNTNKSPTLMIHPFVDPRYPMESAGPEHVKFRWIKQAK